ncbi:MAG: glycosyltransferase [Bacilli bacterium]|nr:glycosyltransferase [Bacilli bacterium]
MRIALFSDTFPPEINGVATSTGNLFHTLKDHGEEVVVVTTNHSGDTLEYSDGVLKIPGLKMKSYDYRLAGFYNKEAMDFLKKFRPEVIHIQMDGGIGQFGFIAAKQLSSAVVYTYHTMYEDYTHYATRGKIFDRAAKTIVRWYVRFKAKTSDEFITPSAKIKEYMRNIGVDQYLNVIPTGIDFSKYKKGNLNPNKIADLKRKYGITDKTFVLLSLGRLAKEKSVDLCIKGASLFIAKHPEVDFKFMVVGAGPALKELEEYAESLGVSKNVVFTGSVDPIETPYYYQLGNAFISASITETQGLTFMEAMASDIPVLARYDDNLLGTINDGKNGFFFLDERDLVNKLETVMNLTPNQRSAIISNAEKTLEPYSLERFYQSAMEVYRRAIKKNW